MADVVVYLKANPYDVENDKEVLSTAIYKRTKNVFARKQQKIQPEKGPGLHVNAFLDICQDLVLTFTNCAR